MIIFFDTETTGLCPGNVIQLAYIMYENGSARAKNFYFYVPFISPSATDVHGITVEKLALLSGGRTFFEYLEEIDDDFRAADVTVAHNFPFDFSFMTSEFSRFDRVFHYKEKFDTMRYFTPIMRLARANGAGFKYPKLVELSEYFEVYPYDVTRFALELFDGFSGGSHDARFDCSEMYLSFLRASEKDGYLSELIKKNA